MSTTGSTRYKLRVRATRSEKRCKGALQEEWGRHWLDWRAFTIILRFLLRRKWTASSVIEKERQVGEDAGNSQETTRSRNEYPVNHTKLTKRCSSMFHSIISNTAFPARKVQPSAEVRYIQSECASRTVGVSHPERRSIKRNSHM